VSYILSRTQEAPNQSSPDSDSVDLHHLALKETSRGQAMTIESMQQSLTAYSPAVTQTSTLDANSQAIARSIQQGLITENLETWKKHELGGAEFSLRNFLS